MTAVKIIIFVIIAGLTIWLIVDTAITITKKIKAKKKKQLEQKDSNDDTEPS